MDVDLCVSSISYKNQFCGQWEIVLCFWSTTASRRAQIGPGRWCCSRLRHCHLDRRMMQSVMVAMAAECI